MSYSKYTQSSLLAALAFAGFSSTQADAALLLELESGVSLVTITDNGPGDIDPLLGSVSYAGSVGVFDVNVSTGISYPIIGSTTDPRLNLNSVNLSSGSVGSITVRVTSTGFVAPVGIAVPTELDFGGTTNGTIGIAAFLDTTNTPFGTAIVAGTVGPGGPGPVSGSDTASVTLAAPYSATLIATVVHDTVGDFSSFNGQLRVVPEPGSIALIAIGAGMLGYRRRRSA